MNYQYRYGTTTTVAFRTLYADGGWTRYYQGLTAALLQGPISRFGDTAANAGILTLFEGNSFLKNLPDHIKSVFIALAAAAFRMILTPIDTVKTTMQTQGKSGLAILKARVCRLAIPSRNFSDSVSADQDVRYRNAVVWSLCHSCGDFRWKLSR